MKGKIEEWYNKHYCHGFDAPSYDRVKKLINLFAKHKADRLLDIGCGEGSLTLLLKESVRAKEVFGVEIASEGVMAAKSKGINCQRLNVDEEGLPFQEEYFDAIFCGELIEHLFDPDHLLREVYRVLKPEGFFIIATPNLGAWYNRIALLIGYQPYAVTAGLEHHNAGKLWISAPAGTEHIRFFTLRALKELLQYHGFKIKHMEHRTSNLGPRT